MNLLVIGLYINSALYLTGCFVAGLMLHNPLAWQLALFSAGMSYVSYYLQIIDQRFIASLAVALAFGAGATSGLFLSVIS